MKDSLNNSNTRSHGGDIYSLKNKQNILDFSVNISPLGLPKSVKEAVISSLSLLEKYPDINQRELKTALANYYSLLEENFFIGNGAGEVIFSLSRAGKFKSALTLAPSFSEYSQAVIAAGGKMESYFLKEENDFLVKEDILTKITPNLDALFLCNPNNPTGALIENGLLKKILEKCKKTNTILVVDECFLDFTGKENECSLLKYINQYDNLFIIKAFTKIYSMAGLRLGFGVTSNKKLLDDIKNVTPPWNVSSVAQLAGINSLKDEEYKNQTINITTQNRPKLKSALEDLGLKVFASETNFLFFKYNGELDLKSALLQKNILIRDCSNYKGLTKGFYRVAVKLNEENERLVLALKEVLFP